MGNAIPLEEGIVAIEEERVYSRHRLIAAMQFAGEATKYNSDTYLKSLRDVKGLWLINPTPLLGPVIAFGACYISTPITAFAYSAFQLEYNPYKSGHVFEMNSQDRLRVVG